MPDTPRPDAASTPSHHPAEAMPPPMTTTTTADPPERVVRNPVAHETPPRYRRPWRIPTDPPAV